MFKLKTQPSLHNLKKLIFTSKVLLFCHCNNVNAAQWLTFKKKLSKVVKIQALLVQSKIAKNSFLFSSPKSSLVAFLAGLSSFQPMPQFKLPLTTFVSLSSISSSSSPKGGCEAHEEQSKQKLPAFDFWDTRLGTTKKKVQKEKKLSHKLSRESKKKNDLLKVKILEPLLQGPTCILGCPDEKTAIQVANFVNKGGFHFLLLGGFLNNTVLTHLDISLFKTIDTFIWAELICVMQSSIAKTLGLSQSPAFSLLYICSYIKK